MTFILIAMLVVMAIPFLMLARQDYVLHKYYRWVPAEQLINDLGKRHGGIDGSIGSIIDGFSSTTGFLVTCKDGTVHRVPNGRWVKK